MITKCIFCLNDKSSSAEHVFPESIGGTLLIHEVCHECNSLLSKVADSPFADCPLTELARYCHDLGGKRELVPFPFSGVGTLDNGQKASLDRDFNPHLKRVLEIEERPDGSLKVNFNCDSTDRDKLEQILGRPLRKKLAATFPDWSAEKLEQEVNAIVAAAREQPSISEHKPIRYRWTIKQDDLQFVFLKIAYELWFRAFGYNWVETSDTARRIREAILSRNLKAPIRCNVSSHGVIVPLAAPQHNHSALLMHGDCNVRLFNLYAAITCEELNPLFMLSQEDARLIIQDFTSGTVTDVTLLEAVTQRRSD